MRRTPIQDKQGLDKVIEKSSFSCGVTKGPHRTVSRQMGDSFVVRMLPRGSDKSSKPRHLM
jgi:hypothetical protein